MSSGTAKSTGQLDGVCVTKMELSGLSAFFVIFAPEGPRRLGSRQPLAKRSFFGMVEVSGRPRC